MGGVAVADELETETTHVTPSDGGDPGTWPGVMEQHRRGLGDEEPGLQPVHTGNDMEVR